MGDDGEHGGNTMVVEVTVIGTSMAMSVRVRMMDDGKDNGGDGGSGTVKW